MQAGHSATRAKVLQIHPTRRCNLRCLHCYSSSSPEAAAALPASLLTAALTAARSEGFDLAGFSGGEPFLYPELAALVRHARELGYYTTVTTNGTLLNDARLAPLRGTLDLVAVSLDGVRESHNRMRGSPQAFDRMRRGLSTLRAHDFAFGVIFTLTQWNLHELDAVAAMAIDEGARLLVVHPLELVGRARHELTESRPDGIELTATYLEVARLRQEYGSRLLVHWDCFDRVAVASDPASFYAGLDPDASDVPLSELVSSLVVEPDGVVVPIEYGFPRAFALGDLHQEPLETMARGWKERTYPAFLSHCESVHADVMARADEGRFFNWYEQVGTERTTPGWR